MAKIMKRGQFFLIALLLLALSMFVLFSFFRTTDTASVTLFRKSSFIELKNIQSSIMRKNDWLADNWWNTSWAYRKRAINTNQQALAEINISIPSNHISNCDNEIRVVNSSGLVDSNVSSINPPCNITFETCSNCDYEIYYGNPNAVAPARTADNSGNVISPTISKEEVSNLCEHFEYIYPIQGIDLECDIESVFASYKRAKYSINFTSTDLKFEGYIG